MRPFQKLPVDGWEPRTGDGVECGFGARGGRKGGGVGGGERMG